MAMFSSFSFSSSGLVKRAHMPCGACSTFLFTNFLLPVLSGQALLILAGCGWSSVRWGHCSPSLQTLLALLVCPGQGSVYLGEPVLRAVCACQPAFNWKITSLPSSFSNMFLHVSNIKKDQQEYH